MLKYQLKRSIVWWVEDVWGRISLWAKPLVIILAVGGMLISIVVAVVAENTRQQSVLLIEKGKVSWVDFTSGYIGINGMTFGFDGCSRKTTAG